MLIANVNELVRDEEVSVVRRSGSCHGQTVYIENGRGDGEHCDKL